MLHCYYLVLIIDKTLGIFIFLNHVKMREYLFYDSLKIMKKMAMISVAFLKFIIRLYYIRT